MIWFFLLCLSTLLMDQCTGKKQSCHGSAFWFPQGIFLGVGLLGHMVVLFLVF